MLQFVTAILTSQNHLQCFLVYRVEFWSLNHFETKLNQKILLYRLEALYKTEIITRNLVPSSVAKRAGMTLTGTKLKTVWKVLSPSTNSFAV